MLSMLNPAQLQGPLRMFSSAAITTSLSQRQHQHSAVAGQTMRQRRQACAKQRAQHNALIYQPDQQSALQECHNDYVACSQTCCCRCPLRLCRLRCKLFAGAGFTSSTTLHIMHTVQWP